MVTHPLSAVTVVPSQTQQAPLQSLDIDPDVQRIHLLALQSDLCRLADSYLNVKILTPAELMQQRIWDLAIALGMPDSEDQVRFAMPLSNTEMANLCGLSETHYKEVRHQLEITGRLVRRERRLWIVRRPPARKSITQSRSVL